MDKQQRVWFLDEARGLSVLLMVLHHGAYDAFFLLGWPLPFLFSGWFGVIRAFFAGVFVLISGCACRLSRNNLRRGARCLLLAAGLSLVTALLIPSQRIRFGVLHLLGCAMLLFACLQPLLDRIPPFFGSVAGFFLFFFCFHAPDGWLGFGPVRISLPGLFYQNAFTAALGFPGPGYASADYFPLVPWLFLFWVGFFLHHLIGRERMEPLRRSICPALGWLGRHSLVVYLLHQPVLYGVLNFGFYLLR